MCLALVSASWDETIPKTGVAAKGSHSRRHAGANFVTADNRSPMVASACFKSKTDAPLVIDSNTPLPAAIVTECFKPVRGRQTQILNPCSSVQLRQPDSCASMDIGWKTTRSSDRIESLCSRSTNVRIIAWVVNQFLTIVNELANKYQPLDAQAWGWIQGEDRLIFSSEGSRNMGSVHASSTHET